MRRRSDALAMDVGILLTTSDLEIETMRKEFVACSSYSTAWRRCPWAAVIVKVEGGFLAFESVTDYQIWKGQF